MWLTTDMLGGHYARYKTVSVIGALAKIVTKKIEDPAVFQMMRDIGQRILAIRTRENLSQKAICKIIGSCTTSQYARWEAGNRMASPFVMATFCEKFGVTMDHIYRGHLPGSNE
jgi:hypothetical protein